MSVLIGESSNFNPFKFTKWHYTKQEFANQLAGSLLTNLICQLSFSEHFGQILFLSSFPATCTCTCIYGISKFLNLPQTLFQSFNIHVL